MLYGVAASNLELITKIIDFDKKGIVISRGKDKNYASIASTKDKSIMIYLCPHNIDNNQLIHNLLIANKNKSKTKSTSKQLITAYTNICPDTPSKKYSPSFSTENDWKLFQFNFILELLTLRSVAIKQ